METKPGLDIDNLNTKVLKKVVGQISIPLAHIINLSFESGILPKKLEISRTVPVYKAGDRENCSNFRPISCLPTLSKVIEKIVSKKLFQFVQSNDILYNLLFGFQPNKSKLSLYFLFVSTHLALLLSLPLPCLL